MLTAIFCGIAAYLLYKVFSLFNSNRILSSEPRATRNNPQEVRPSENDLREMQLMKQQQTHDNTRTAVAGLTGALAGAALMHHHDEQKDDLQRLHEAYQSDMERLFGDKNAADAAQRTAEEKNIAAADDAGMDYDEFMNTDRTYDDNGNVIDYDDNDDWSFDKDNNDTGDDDDNNNNDDYDPWSDDSNNDDYSSSYDNDHNNWGNSDDGGFFGGSDDGGFFGGSDSGDDGGDWF